MTAEPVPSGKPSLLARIWADLVAAGWRDAVLRYATHALLLALLVAAIWARGLNLGFADWLAARLTLHPAGGSVVLAAPNPGGNAANAAATPVPQNETVPGMTLSAAAPATATVASGVARLADGHTQIPTRGRTAVITYTVSPGDTLFGIADKFGLKPETLLWGNYFVLKDDPHLLFPKEVLNILPVDGTYHLVTKDNTLDKIARFYGVTVQDVLDWPGNNLDPQKPVLVPGSYLVVPGGHRELTSWQVPTIPRSAKTTAATNIGQCPGGYSGAVGTGGFVWPSLHHYLSGYDFTPIHHGIDIADRTGDPVYAADSGVIVYAGPNSFGFGNLIVIDHGNGWQTIYGHLSQWNVTCGQSVLQASLIGLSGNTGNSSGPHLHFEMHYNGAFVNPWTVLPPP
jgi:murein DD-endopeptidase MepM/ murein hydrolase activator NlpD